MRKNSLGNNGSKFVHATLLEFRLVFRALYPNPPVEGFPKILIASLITCQFRGIKMPTGILEDLDRPSPPEDSMSLVEKMEMARWHTTAPFDYLPEPEHVDQQPEEVQVHPRYKEVRSFLLDSSAYQWLIENAESSALLTGRKGTILDAVKRQVDSTFSSMITPKSRQPQIFQAKFDIDWDLLSFLENQEYDTTLEFAVEHAITITGSKNNAQALSCMDYMCQTWPSSGREVVRVVQKALVSPNLCCSSKQSFEITIHT